MTHLLPPQDLPDGFAYPQALLRIVEHDLIEPHPWWVLTGDALAERHRGICHRFPDRQLVVFARRQDNDDIACYDAADPACPVVVIHDFATPGWENRATYPSTYDWLRQAVDDFIHHDERATP